MKIKVLSKELIDKISAGEVIERPASIIKELVENSIDANAKNIEIHLENAGKKLVSIKDDGWGIEKDDLPLAVVSHATSKLNIDNLFSIQTLGFRGEALASISAISKITIASKYVESSNGYMVECVGGELSQTNSFAIKNGTYIKVEDLFSFTPARLKFLRSDSTENIASYKIFKNLALSQPTISFRLFSNQKEIYNYYADENNSLKHRVFQILGGDFIDNAIYFQENNPLFKIYGYLGSPTYTKNNAESQYIIVNGRALRDKFLNSLLRVAYSNVLFGGQYPCYAIFLDINPNEIDVNVNPTKSEIRFKDIQLIRHLIISAIKKNLGDSNLQINNSNIGINLFSKNNKNISPASLFESSKNTLLMEDNHKADHNEYSFKQDNFSILNIDNNDNDAKNLSAFPLGFAKAQFHKNWIIAENINGLVIVDQHAAHERINQEKLVKNYLKNNVSSQMLMNQEMIEIDPIDYEALKIFKSNLFKLGIDFDFFSKKAIVIKSLPALLKNPNTKILFQELLLDLKNIQSLENFDKQLYDVVARIACHKSIRSGQILSIEEMNLLLREMEKTPNYGQCPHGRPTFSEIKLKNIELLFGRI